MNLSIWAEDLADFRGSGDSVPADADTVVIGAGYTGLTAARELARAGQRVVVFDKDSIGDGASGVNFGSAAMGVEAGRESISRRYGTAFSRNMARLSREVLEDFARLAHEEGIECDLRKSGHLTIALNERELAQLERRRRAWDGLPEAGPILLPGSEARRYCDVEGICGGLLNPDSYVLNPAKYLLGLVHAAVRAGVAIVERTPVAEVRRLGRERFESCCGPAIVRSKHVIVCTNGDPMPGCRPSERGMVPIHGYLIATAPLSDEQLRPISRHAFATVHTMPDYFRVTAGNRLLFGSRQDLAARPSPLRDARELVARMHALLPFTSGFLVTHSWSGAMGFTFDRLPHVGVADGIHYALGYCGKGIPWSVYCGRAVADLVTGAREPGREVSTPVILPRFHPGHSAYRRFLSWQCRMKDGASGFTPRRRA